MNKCILQSYEIQNEDCKNIIKQKEGQNEFQNNSMLRMGRWLIKRIVFEEKLNKRTPST